MLTQTAEHALRAVLYLARANGTAPVPAAAIARALGAPPNYLSKTLYALGKAGIVKGQRGPTGGFRLTVRPEELTLARVVEAIKEPQPNAICLLGDVPCSERTPCQAHLRWKAIAEAAWSPLRETTVAQLLEGSDRDLAALRRLAAARAGGGEPVSGQPAGAGRGAAARARRAAGAAARRRPG